VPRSASTRSKVLTHTGAEDARAASCVLASRHPQLIPEIEQIVREASGATTCKDVADEVVAATGQLTMFDLGRCDSGDPLGYKDQTESAMDVVEETIQPLVETIRRLADMGLTESAPLNCEVRCSAGTAPIANGSANCWSGSPTA
jgi:hypothetical protein